jgi:hypothetical protein
MGPPLVQDMDHFDWRILGRSGCTALDITQHDPAASVDRLLPFLEMDTATQKGRTDDLGTATSYHVNNVGFPRW